MGMQQKPERRNAMLARKLALAVAAGAALVSTSAFADPRWGHERWEHERWEHRHHWHPYPYGYVVVRPAPVVVAPYYAPAPAYVAPAPAYYPAPVYAQPSVSVRFRLPL